MSRKLLETKNVQFETPETPVKSIIIKPKVVVKPDVVPEEITEISKITGFDQINPDFLPDLIDIFINEGEEKVNEIINNNPTDFLFYYKQEDHIKGYERELEEKIKPAQVIEGTEECRKCHTKKTWNYSIQTRSGDEGMTTFFTCINCGSKWHD